ncbi:MAG: hypothetical protein WCC25_09420 [Candidatus Korobacteraceae bacterium]
MANSRHVLASGAMRIAALSSPPIVLILQLHSYISFDDGPS